MRSILYLIAICIVTSRAFVIDRRPLSSVIKNGVYDYHRSIGIALAESIKNNEDNMALVQRIAGGSLVEIDTVPYQAGLLITVLNVYQSVCGGSLISETRVLTAAHCYHDGVTTAQKMMVVLGSSLLFSGGTRIETRDVIVHSEFSPNTLENDITVVIVPSVAFTLSIQPVALPSGEEVNMDFTGFAAVASGYGVTSDETSINLLQTVSSVTVPVISNGECIAAYGGYILEEHLCTSGERGVGTCAGDSGGPLVVELGSRTVLIGITSFGAEQCEASYPSAFVRVTNFLEWISQSS